jgi:hypothetical protein
MIDDVAPLGEVILVADAAADDVVGYVLLVVDVALAAE